MDAAVSEGYRESFAGAIKVVVLRIAGAAFSATRSGLVDVRLVMERLGRIKVE